LKGQKLPTKNEIKKNVFKRDFYSFLQDSGKSYWVHGKHLEFLAGKIQDVVNGKTRKLMVTMPPRHGKSEVISKRFPAWFLLNNPDKEVLITSYSGDISYDFSRASRQTFVDYGELYGLSLDRSSKSVGHWEVGGHRGGLIASGVGGSITGRGFHIGIIDDPVKNRQEANSITIRNKIWEWYQSTFRTRGYPDSTQILVQTRWHEDDLAGRLLREQKGEWEVIDLPAFAESNDMIGREEGEPLWPERYPVEELENIKHDIGSYEWLALYQQKPTRQGGNIFKQDWFQWVNSISYDKLRIYQTIDLAASTKTESDYFALLTFGMDPDSNIYIFDLYMGHLEFPQQIKVIEQYYTKWMPLQVGVETVAYQNVMEQYLRNKTPIPVKKLKPTADKVTRALRITPHFENGKVFILRDLPNRDLFERQLLQFPNGKHDDAVDVTSYILDMINIEPRVRFINY